MTLTVSWATFSSSYNQTLQITGALSLVSASTPLVAL